MGLEGTGLEVGQIVKDKTEPFGLGVITEDMDSSSDPIYEHYPDCKVTWVNYQGMPGRFAQIAHFADELERVWG